ncbi:ribonuclease H [Bacillus phage vB_BpuM-BpSp]|nr:ribonuclease H [Bacillus phage vB_BpuM-BpSp]
MTNIVLFSDAASYHNGKEDAIGTSCAIITNNMEEIIDTVIKGFDQKNNDFCELMGALSGLDYLYNNHKKLNVKSIEIISDAVYVIRGCNEWLYNWSTNGWIGSSGEEIKNKKLWMLTYNYINYFNNNRIPLKFTWVKGHKGKAVTKEENPVIYYQELSDTKAVEYKNKLIEHYR